MDEDCNGTPDDEPADCDDGIAIGANDAFDGAKAMGLCKKATDDRMWGVIEAKWVKPDGSPQSDALGQGILPSFGVNAAQTGDAVLAISSGTARGPNDTGYKNVSGYSKNYTSGTPAGYPKEAPSCSGSGGRSMSRPISSAASDSTDSGRVTSRTAKKHSNTMTPSTMARLRNSRCTHCV